MTSFTHPSALLCVQFYDVAVGDSMIRPYLLSVECAAPPQTCEFEGPGDIMVHKSRDIRHCVALTHDERSRPVGRMSGRLGVYTYDPQATEHKWRELRQPVAFFCRDGDCRESHA